MTPTAQFDKRVTVQQKTVVGEDDNGQEILDWTPFITRWAKIEQKGGNEEFRNDRQTKATVMYQVTLRSDSETRQIGPTHRIVIDGRTLSIKSAYDDGMQKREMIIDCVEVL